MKRSKKFQLLIPSCILTGCVPNEEEIWGLGSLVFIVFVMIIVLTTIAPRIQDIPAFRKFIERLQGLAKLTFPFVLLLSLGMIFWGVFRIAIHEDRSSLDLVIFVGATLLYLAISQKKWATTNDKYRKRNYARAIGLSASFILVFVYLIFGAPNLNL